MLIIIAILLFIIVLILTGLAPQFLKLLLHGLLCCVFAGLGLGVFFLLNEIATDKLWHNSPWMALMFAISGPAIFYGWLSERR